MEENVPAAPRPRTSPRIVLACAAAVVLFVGPVAMLYWTWLPRQSPSTMIVVQADASFDGAEVAAEQLGGGGAPLVGRVASEDGYRLRMHVPPGIYRVTVRVAGKVVSVRQAEPGRMSPAFMQLTDDVRATATATTGRARR